MADRIKNLVQVYRPVQPYSVEEGIVLGIRNVFADVPGGMLQRRKLCFCNGKTRNGGSLLMWEWMKRLQTVVS